MKIEKNINIKLSPEDVQKIIADYLVKDGYNVTPENVHFDVSTQLEGYGTMEHEVTKFRGCSVNCKEK